MPEALIARATRIIRRREKPDCVRLGERSLALALRRAMARPAHRRSR